MAFSTYYINGNSLTEATAVFTDVDLTILANDDYYSDGFVVRRQVSGELLSPEACPYCTTPCDGSITLNNSQPGQYLASIDAGATIGAVRVEYNVYSVPDALRMTWDSNVYNSVTSENFGFLGSASTNPVFFGDVNALCDDNDPIIPPSGVPMLPCPGPCTPLSALPVYQYSNGIWSDLGTTVGITVAAADVQLTAGPPNPIISPGLVLYIPKTAAGPSNIDVEMYGVCFGTIFKLTVYCPVDLTPIDTSAMNAAIGASSGGGACGSALTTQIFNGHVNGSPGVPGQYDWAFSNANSGVAGVNTYMAAGYYKYIDGLGNDRYLEVDSNGVILLTGACPP